MWQDRAKGPHLNLPPPFPLGDTLGIHFYCQWDAVKAMSCEPRRPLNLRHNLEVSHDVNRSFHMMSFVSLKSSRKHDVKRLKSYLLHQLFGLHVFREHATWTQSCERGDEPQPKSQPNPRSAAAWYSVAEKKGAFIDYRELKSSEYEMKSPVCPGYHQWRGVECASDWCITPCKLVFLPLNYFSYLFSLTCFMKVVPFYDHLLLHIRIKWHVKTQL